MSGRAVCAPRCRIEKREREERERKERETRERREREKRERERVTGEAHLVVAALLDV